MLIGASPGTAFRCKSRFLRLVGTPVLRINRTGSRLLPNLDRFHDYAVQSRDLNGPANAPTPTSSAL